MNIVSIRNTVLVSIVSCLLLACSAVKHGANTSDNEQSVDHPASGTALESVSYFRMASTAEGVERSSQLTLLAGQCFLTNFYNFPDQIFGDSDLDNTTTTPLELSACRRLAIAESMKTAGACAVQSTSLSQTEMNSIAVDPTTQGLLVAVLPSTSFSSVGDLASSASVSLDLSADCVCSVSVAPAGSATLNVTLQLPTSLDLCASKFPRYSATALSRALADIKTRYGLN